MRKFSSVSNLSGISMKSKIYNFYSTSVEVTTLFFSFNVFYAVTDIYRFSNIKAVFQSWDKHATWSWYILFFCTCVIQFANVLFKIFVSCSQNNFLVPIFSSFSIKVKNAPENIFLNFPPFYISKLVWD